MLLQEKVASCVQVQVMPPASSEPPSPRLANTMVPRSAPNTSNTLVSTSSKARRAAGSSRSSPIRVGSDRITADSITAVLKVDSLGETVATFGGVNRGTSGSRLDEHFREIAVGTGDGVWTVGHTEYVVEKWTRDGSLIGRWKRMPDWFSTEEGQASGKGAGAPRILSARLDREGRLWTFAAVADEEAAGRRDAAEGDRLLAHRRYDTVVEVLDPEAGRLIARKRFDRLLRVTGDGRYVFAVERAEAGNHQISLGALELVAP